jgi:RNA polymerase sigma-70 factor (ECF subfamily)
VPTDPNSELPDEQLLRRARRDPKAFAVFYDRHVDELEACLRRQTESGAAAMDMTAETFASALASAHRFRDRGEGSARAWLFGIARNVLAQQQRTLRSERAARMRLGIPLADYSALEGDDELERIDTASRAPELRAEMSRLPAEQQAAVQLRIVDQLPYGEVAKRIGCSEDSARAHVSRALRKLRVRLGEGR